MIDITNDDIKQLIDSGLYESSRELSNAIGINEVTVHEWLTGKKNLTNIHKKLWYYFIQCNELKKQVSQLQEQLQNSTRADNQTELLKDLNQFKEEINKRFEKVLSQIKKIDARSNNENNDLNSKDQYKIILDTLQKENDKRLQKLTKDISTDILSTIKKELLKDDINQSTELLKKFNVIESKMNALLKSNIIKGLIKENE